MKRTLHPSAFGLTLPWPNPGKERSSHKLQGALAWVVALLVLAFAQPVMGMPLMGPETDPTNGGPVLNPDTGTNETVAEVIYDVEGAQYEALTTSNNLILLLTSTDDLFEAVSTTNTTNPTYEVIDVNSTNTLPMDETVTVEVEGTTNTTNEQVVTSLNGIAPAPPPVASLPQTPPTTTSGVIDDVYVAAGGDNGSDAYGVDILGVNIGVSGSNGSPGATGTNVLLVVPSSWGLIQSTTSNTPGITLASEGGPGGSGGNSYGNIGPYYGGTGGNGGSANLVNHTDITTSGKDSDGIYVLSASGSGGGGGNSYILWQGGGGGGGVGYGGSVTVTNTAYIQTSGNQADGIYGLAIGGNAGSGGSSYGIVGSGGTGGGGGEGGTVEITNSGQITTDGIGAHGIEGQSIGGSGGDGGDAGGLAAFGGPGNAAGSGSNVMITNSGDILTQGATSDGILAQSIGGSGGDSGAAGGIGTIGGSGGTGNEGGSVTVDNNRGGQIVTEGQDSYGILAQSIGGGGGNTSPSGGLYVNMGGSGGGGDGSTVNVYNDGLISTTGTNGIGIMAQSIGGGGGSAGVGGGLVSLGGSGGDGGNGGSVSVTNDTLGSISTTGDGAYAIFAQSIGGGGGAGSVSAGLVAIGGQGTSGGAGGAVTVVNSGSLTTLGVEAKGIFVQSIGGGGGAGGLGAGLFGMGGDSSSTNASNGSNVLVINNATGTISTAGNGADGIFVQSIGGGGGMGGLGSGLVSLGGSGGAASAGGDVTVDNAGDIQTQGVDARGIFAQSIGGGGGSGGDGGGAFTIGGSGGDAGAAGDVTVTNTGIISTTGDQSTAIFAQSVGGGGGDGGSTGGLVSVGGTASSGGAGGGVTVTQGGNISTLGVGALGIFAQSVGGGGGNGGDADSGSLFLGVALGGSGANGGAGGDVGVVLEDDQSDSAPSNISTSGDGATGILEQSVGGGGGNGGNAIQATVGSGASVSIAIGGTGGNGGQGGTVSLTGTGDVETHGADADGIILQSVGGGGGNGGTTISASASVSPVGSIGVAVAVGGDGGSGGQGGTVTVDLTSAIQTSGDLSSGFVAQSVGGGGGNGGSAIAATASAGGVGAAAVSVAVGGKAGSGGAGGTVQVTLDGSVTTQGDQSDGILIQSIGGGGGNGGEAIAAGLAAGGAGALNVDVGLGGAGGGGGGGGTVDATIGSVATGSDDVTTSGDGSSGVIIQSIGGGGGNSGLTVAAGVAGGGLGAGGVSVSVGATSGTGGDGGLVDASYDGNLITKGNDSPGLLVQSVGGGGGNSGGTIAASGSAGGVGSGGVSVGIGGSGGGGGNGGVSGTNSVTLSTMGSVSTTGDNSSAIVVQSIGGGGGNGGYDISAALSGGGTGSGAVAVGMGGDGGNGGMGENVLASLASNVTTSGDNSSGVVVQSVGGGSGNGGYNISGSLSFAGVGSGAISVGLGGSGGGGATGGDVIVTSSGTIYTDGTNSAGLVVESIGGGGGNGGFNVSADLSGAGTGSGAISVGLGGSGGTASDGGTVTVTNTGNIETMGADSGGILAESIGGGGGNGGFDVSASLSAAGTGSGAIGVGLGGKAGGGGDGSNVMLSVTNDYVTTSGDNSIGIEAQSVGGGGGNGGFNITAAASGAGTGSGAASVGLGGSGGAGGNGGTVTSIVTSDITTGGDYSTGLLVQSVGGGGGNGGFDISAALSGASTGSVAAAVGIGGSGGSGGYASEVDSSMTGNTSTTGNDSAGIVAQSLGGGGGNGGMNISAAISGASTGSAGLSVGIGGSGGSGGYAGEVINYVDGNVTTEGSNSTGILAQSVGGGGGNGGISISGAISLAGTGSGAISIGLGGSGGDGGYAQDVTNTDIGNVQTYGADSPGVVVQSLGGGGGNGGLDVSGAISLSAGSGATVGVGLGGSGGSGGTAGNVINTSTIDYVTTTGDNSPGVVAESVGGGGGNGGINVTGDINVTKGSGGAIGVGIGGFGGGGQSAGDVTNTVTSTDETGGISTTGDDSSAVIAQSLGGGGGNGGLNVTGSINVTGGSGVSVGVGVGGFGGGAGNGGDVTVGVNLAGFIYTYGNNSDGILAQSIGGGGGDGATDVSGSMDLGLGFTGDSTAISAAIGVGGFGGGGGTGGTVTVNYDGTQMDVADGSGILAQSIGGGGGDGGINVSGTLAYGFGTNGKGYGLTLGIGGFGGAGGDAGEVTVNVTGTGDIIAGGSGDEAIGGGGNSGILAQSIGGGGGNGGLNVSSGVSSTAGITVGLGGFGANAGTSSNVTVNATTDITVYGVSGNGPGAGILAQSLGGGGGNGGWDIAGNFAINTGTSKAPSINVGIGGFGGAGAASGNVTVDEVGVINTTGDQVDGIEAQSLAGGGGNGGINISVGATSSSNVSINAGVGGTAGAGANAGTVTVTDSGAVTTSGDLSTGVFAQSAGGGGGTGGMNFSGLYASSGSPIVISVGGSGGDGGNGNTVTVVRGTSSNDAGLILTDGDSAAGIEAYSLGGGGGDAGVNINAAYSSAGAKSGPSGFAAQFAIGGSGADSGNGGIVTVTNYSDIITDGTGSDGILAQSIGGGGGNASLNISVTSQNDSSNDMGFSLGVGGGTGSGGTGTNVTVTDVGDITTYGDESDGIEAQSIGGGGGNAGLNVVYDRTTGPQAKIVLGTTGGGGGSGGDVVVTYSGTITTTGNVSYGILAQSLGNGGGDSSSTSVSATSAESSNSQVQSLNVSVGLTGGLGGAAGDATVTAAGSIYTDGTNSYGIFAQSIGGGGGNGGSANTAGTVAPTVGVAVGGSGGTGGTGGTVQVNSTADIYTSGDSAIAILAQSVGGGGGTGGMAENGDYPIGIFTGAQSGNSLTVTVGGGGGDASSGGNVTVDTSGYVETYGDSADGVLAQSIGGGGGDSGMAISTQSGSNTPGSGNVSFTVGGSGGTGGNGGAVTVTNSAVTTSGDVVANSGEIVTNGNNSIGIFAQSVGGGGGAAKTVITGGYTTGGGSVAVTDILGGNGGMGGNGSDVTVANLTTDSNTSGIIYTTGTNSDGILAMSVGGGGGSGSTTINAAVTNPGASTTASKTSITLNMGGDGGDGGSSGNVSVLNQGTIETLGDSANGIVALSIGGGGGIGGMALTGAVTLSASTSSNAVSIALGGNGGSGGQASGNITVTNSGSIITYGNNSDGIFAESIGGGGGNAGFAASLSNNLFTNPFSLQSIYSNLALGGVGGSGGNSGNVTVLNSGSITVYGNNSYGIYAESISGGGGTAAYSISAPAAMAADALFATFLGGGSTGTAGTVTIDSTGSITMSGQGDIAQYGQSVNGGGGNVSTYMDYSSQAVDLDNDSNELPSDDSFLVSAEAFVRNDLDLGSDPPIGDAGTNVSVTTTGDVLMTGYQSIGSLYQSIGGGGGHLLNNTVVDTAGVVDDSIVLGEVPAVPATSNVVEGNDGGTVTVTNVGNITMTSNDSPWAVIQSIGGGGGDLLDNVSVVTDSNINSTNTPLTALVTVGAAAGLGNNGSAVTFNYTGTIVTLGDRSYGLLAQSIGAGGGVADVTGFDTVQVDIGGQNGVSGNGGSITGTNTGNIETMGAESDGVILQSIGGGGGLVLTDLASGATYTTNSDNSGNGGNISFTQTGDIFVTGTNSIGILAQSLGGGGGAVDRNFFGTAGGTGTSGTIQITVDGSIVADGPSGIGIFAQSQGSSGQGAITLLLTSTNYIYFGAGGVGVDMSGGTTNTFTNDGEVGGVDGVQGMAVAGDTGDNAVLNYGEIIGSANLGTGTGTFNNEAGAVLQSGPVINLSSAGTFYNAGTILPGGFGNFLSTAVTGNYVQTGNAIWYFDIGSTPSFTSDEWQISGTANLGTTNNYTNTINLNQLTGVPSTTGSYTLITAASGLNTGSFQFGTMTGFTMPIGLTYTLSNSSSNELLVLSPSSGPFYWEGAVSNVWNTDFVNGQTNWISGATNTGTNYIFGTPGVADDVYFASSNPLSTNTVILGADFIVNSLNVVGNTMPVTIDGTNTLTIAAAEGNGITLDPNAPATTINVDLILAGNQSWTNNSTSLLDINGPTVTSTSNQNLTVAGPGNTDIYSQIATGSGSLTKTGAGTLILYSTSNTYTGGTFIQGGFLAVDTAQALGLGNVTNTGGTLETTETLGGVARTIYVAANFTQTTGGTLLLQVVSSPSASPSLSTGTPGTNYENLVSTDNATLGGTLDLNFAPAAVPTPGQRYVVVTAGNPLTGNFIVQTTTNLPTPFFTVTTDNDTFGGSQPANSAIVTLMKPFTSFTGLNSNQLSVAQSIDNDLNNLNNSGALAYPAGNAADFFNSIITALNSALLTNGMLATSLDQLSPERLELLRNVSIENFSFFSQQLDDHLANLRDGFTGLDTTGLTYSDSALGSSLSSIEDHLLAWQPVATPGLLSDTPDPILAGVVMANAQAPDDDRRWSAFINGTVMLADFNSNADEPYSNYTTGGVTLGADYRLDKNWVVGALFGYSHTDASLDEEGSTATIDTYSPGIYAAYMDNGWYANGLFNYGYNSYTENRDIELPGFDRIANGSPQGNQYSGSLDGGYEFHAGNWTIGPSAGLDYVHLDINNFSETGAGAADLNIQKQVADSLQSQIGFNTRLTSKCLSTKITYHFSAYWQHQYMANNVGITSSLEIPDTTPFTVQSPGPDRDSALLDTGLDAQVFRNLDLFFDYQANVGQSDFFEQSFQGGVKVEF
ncbi:MAG: hypothetical protein LV481_04445 [Methylacidiphilales bacterium]|nr:hypothetical protein [Candidatus Methylacidiphilales bacterium]